MTTFCDGYGRRWSDDGPDDGRWVDPRRTTTKAQSPYGYSEFFHFGGPITRLDKSEAAYDDRLRQWSEDKWKAAWRTVPEGVKHFQYMGRATASAFLSAYHGDRVECEALAEGCNASSGYPYFIFWFKRVGPIAATDDGKGE